MQTIALPADRCENSIHRTNHCCRPAISSYSRRPFSVTIFSHRNSINSSTPDGLGRLLYTREDPGVAPFLGRSVFSSRLRHLRA
ncbi:hypothetical protein VTN49DRAFT_2481 [Thermomyces lanuginosus]|uniref:uncharacterized protein n=1 Tax=Thermomyces lanuginosus TaxID=5541 RepID=UPI0037428796